MIENPRFAQIESDGFAVLQGFFEAQRIDDLALDIEQAASTHSRAGIRHALALPPVVEIAKDEAMLQLARAVLGSEAFPYRATLFDKSPQSNWLVVWHQDTALPIRTTQEVPGWGPWSVKEGIPYAHAPFTVLQRVLALRLHLDDSTIENGPLRVLCGTHKLGVLSDDQIHELATNSRPFDCLVSKGGVLAMRPLIVHASSKSHNAMPRRVLHVEYAASPSIATPLDLAIA